MRSSPTPRARARKERIDRARAEVAEQFDLGLERVCDVLRARGGRASMATLKLCLAERRRRDEEEYGAAGVLRLEDVIDHWYPKLVHDATDEKIVLRGWRCECLLSVLKLRWLFNQQRAQPGRYRRAPLPALVPLFSLDDGLVRHVLEFWVGGPAEPHPVCMLELLLDQHVSAAEENEEEEESSGSDELEADDEGKPVLLCAKFISGFGASNKRSNFNLHFVTGAGSHVMAVCHDYQVMDDGEIYSIAEEYGIEEGMEWGDANFEYVMECEEEKFKQRVIESAFDCAMYQARPMDDWRDDYAHGLVIVAKGADWPPNYDTELGGWPQSDGSVISSFASAEHTAYIERLNDADSDERAAAIEMANRVKVDIPPLHKVVEDGVGLMRGVRV